MLLKWLDGYVAPSAVVLPAPIDTTLTDPVAIEREALRYANGCKRLATQPNFRTSLQ
jgi:hypothetical protein